MENAVDALKIAFGVLLFVLALSITIPTFSNATQAVKRIVATREESKSFVKYIDEEGNEKYLNYINYSDTNTTREVGLETVIPMIYRATKENIDIYFKFKESPNFNESEKSYFTEKVQNGTTLYKLNYGIAGDTEEQERTRDKIAEIIYGKIGNATTIEEKLGEYYMEDESGVDTDTEEINKIKKRIIVYNVK